MKFAAKSVPHFPPHLGGVTILSSKIQQSRIGEILLRVPQ